MCVSGSDPVVTMSTVAELAKLAPVAPPTKRPIRQSLLSVREKIDAIDRVHEGESKAAVARDIGVPESTLRGWCKTEEKLRSLARACEGSDTPPSDLDKDQDPYSPDPKRFRVESENRPKSVNLGTGVNGMAGVGATGAEVDEALWFWLKQQQQQVGLSVNERLLEAKVGANGHESSGWFWRWYKQYGGQAQPLPLAERSRSPPTPQSLAHTPLPLPVSVLQPVPVVAPAQCPSASPERDPYEAPLSLVKNDRCHSAALENNNVPVSKMVESEEEEDDEPPETAAEALKHGERFLRWLDCCSDPSVTAVQILQFRYLLNNVRACVDRRRAQQVKTKEKSRRK